MSLSFLLRFPLCHTWLRFACCCLRQCRTAWHVRGTGFPLHCRRMLKLLRFFEHTYTPPAIHTQQHTHSNTHTVVSCLAAAAIKDDTTERSADKARKLSWIQRKDAEQTQRGSRAEGCRGQGCPLNAPNHNLTGAAMTQFTHSPTCNLQLRLKCVWQVAEGVAEAEGMPKSLQGHKMRVPAKGDGCVKWQAACCSSCKYKLQQGQQRTARCT